MPDQSNQATPPGGKSTPLGAEPGADIGAQVKEVGAKMVDAAREKVRGSFEKQQRRAADEISGVAGALRDAAERLSAEDRGGTAHYVRSAADRAAKLADQVRDRGLDDVVAQAEGLARRQPELFVGGALLAGVALGRFLKATSNRRRLASDIDIATRPRPTVAPAGQSTRSSGFDYPTSSLDPRVLP